MRKLICVLALFCSTSLAQQRWSATTGSVSLSGTAYTATIQQPATGQQNVQLEQVTVYCSVSCTITQYANGTAATATSGTINPLLPNTSYTGTATFWTASNVGTGTLQGGAFTLSGPGTQSFCLNTSCGALRSIQLPLTGTGSNYSITISSITGNVNITFFGQSY
jgi:hypothetical protein